MSGGQQFGASKPALEDVLQLDLARRLITDPDGEEEVAAFFRSFFEQVRAAREGPPYLYIVPEDLRIDPLGEAAVVTVHLSDETEVGRRTLVFDRDERDGRAVGVTGLPSALDRVEVFDRVEENR